MTIDFSVVLMLFHVTILLLALLRLHSVEVYEPTFVFYLTLVIANAVVSIGDIGALLKIDLGPISIVGNPWRIGTYNVSLIVGLAYVAIRGQSRRVDVASRSTAAAREVAKFEAHNGNGAYPPALEREAE